MRNQNLAILGGEKVIKESLKPFNSLGPEETNAVIEVMKNGQLSEFLGSWGEYFSGGKQVKNFEKLWSLKFKVKFSVSVNSNTTGLLAALGAVGVSPGDEVIVPPLSMSATAVTPLFYGGIPVFVDIEEDTFCLDPDRVKASITNKTKAIVVTNIFGHPAKLKELRSIADENNIYLIEDNAQAPLAIENNAFAGTIGHIGVFSLNYHKHIHTGEGGMCCTNDKNLNLRLEGIRNHAENIVAPANIKDITNMIGLNLRMTELSAAIGISQLNKIDNIVKKRQDIVKKLNEFFTKIEDILTPKVRRNCTHVYYDWVLKLKNNKNKNNTIKILNALHAEGVPIFKMSIKPLYELPVFQRKIAIGNKGWPFSNGNIEYSPLSCPIAENLLKNDMYELPTCAYQFDHEELELIDNAIEKVLKYKHSII